MRARVLIPAAAAVLVVVAALAASLSRISVGTRDSGDTLDRPAGRGRAPGAGPTPAAEAPAEPLGEFDWPAWISVVALLVPLALVALVLVTAWRQRRRDTGVRRRRRRRPAGQPSRSTGAAAHEQELVAAIDESLAVLAGGNDPRAAVIGCWVRLQDVAAAAGVTGKSSDTTDDLVWRLLRSHRVSEPVLAGLAEVYRLARYSPHPVDDGMSRDANAALRQLRDDLAGSDVGASV